MKVGDLVRLKSRFMDAPIGLIVSIERRPDGWGGDLAKLEWLDGNYNPYRGLDDLEVINESR